MPHDSGPDCLTLATEFLRLREEKKVEKRKKDSHFVHFHGQDRQFADQSVDGAGLRGAGRTPVGPEVDAGGAAGMACPRN